MVIGSVLAIETSCDDTSVSVVGENGRVESLVSAHQDLAHEPFGGVVPEIASRNHTLAILPLVEKALVEANKNWDQIEGIAVTNRPGLIGSLIVGLVTAKTLSQIYNKPLIGVNHLEGHIVAPLLDAKAPKGFDFPFVALAVSGGHTTIYDVRGFGEYKILGATLDDAAGEAWDKFGKMLGLGFPGGVRVDREAQKGRRDAYAFPRSMILEDHLDMSFSGLKSASHRLLQSLGEEEVQKNRADLCASFQEAVVDVLMVKLEKALQKTGYHRAVITGGVSANSRLRARVEELQQERPQLQLVIPPLKYCTDNAAMIGYAGWLRLARGEHHDLSLGPSPNSWEKDFLA